VGRWAGRGSNGKVYGAMGTAWERWEGIWGVGEGAGVMARSVGQWAGRGTDGKVYGAMERYMGLWGGRGSDLEVYGAMGRARE